MKIKELIALDIFKTSKVLTKDIGLENEVESAMVLEALDIEKWSKKNQLILTSFYAFDELTPQALRIFFEKMQLIGVSGLIVKVDRLISMIPEWLIDLCFEFEIPLIKVSQDLTYEKIMLSIYEPLLNHQSHVLRTYYEVRQRFTKIERNLPSFDQLLSEFHLIINKSCRLEIPSHRINIKEGYLQDDLVVTNAVHLKSSEFTKNNYELLTLFSHRDAKELYALKVQIVNRYFGECTLLVYQKENDFKETDMMIIENAIDIIQEKLQMEYLIKRERYARMNNLADAILQNTPSNLDELDSLLNEANLNRHTYYQAVAFSTKSLDSQTIKKETLSRLRRMKRHVIFFEHHDYSVVLYNFPTREEALTKADLLYSFRETFNSLPGLTFAISSIKNKEDLKEVLLECLDIIRFNRAYYIDSVLELADIGIFRYFIRENKMAEINTIIPQKLIQLNQEHYELFETLHSFFMNNRNYKRTAEALFLHPKTIRYRLGRVEELLAIDLTNPLQLLNYETGTYLLKLKKRGIHHERTSVG
ncbi:purine catabolism regulatory protein [Enterococcus florum]|uniref:Purine catabolism regulatory protein n=1 Tax=Enterococcus florum TaxID=2480627 RepID=A0A4P5PAW4_9ENTE|nr:PucR family transcriptional regulator [Enterococcus florum]GCF95265.1 purine catabolism regulatory protein [Enterococcus florum]